MREKTIICTFFVSSDFLAGHLLFVILLSRVVVSHCRFYSSPISSKLKARDKRTDGQTEGVKHLMWPPKDGRIITVDTCSQRI